MVRSISWLALFGALAVAPLAHAAPQAGYLLGDSDDPAQTSAWGHLSDAEQELPLEADDGEEPQRGAVSSHIDSLRRPSLAVVVLSNAAGRPFDGAVDNYLLEGLSKQFRIVPMAAVHKAIIGMHPRASALHLPPTLIELGRRLGTPYIMVIEAVGRARPSHIFVGVVDVRAETTLLAHRQPVPAGKLTRPVGTELARRIRHAVRAGRPVAPPSPQREAGDEMAPQAARERGDDKPAAKTRIRRSEEPAVVVNETMARGLLPRLKAGAGMMVMQRVSKLKTPIVDGVSPPCYCGNKNNAQPFFPAFVMAAEATSGSFTKQRRRLWDGIGARMELVLAPVKTKVINGTTQSTVNSLVLGLDAGLFYRLALLPARALTPDLQLGVGYHTFAFPLKGTQYTGVKYQSANIALGINVPVHTTLGLFAQFALRPGLSAGKEATTLLGKPSAGLGFAVGGGLRGAFRIFAFDFGVQWESFGVKYKGQTNLVNMPTGAAGTPSGDSGTPVQFTDVKLTDSVLGLAIKVSVAL